MLTQDTLYQKLSEVTALREHRLEASKWVLNDLSLLPHLIDIVFKVDDAISCRAAWVLEFVCNAELNLIIPYLDTFTANIHRVHLDSAIRPMAKICELIITAHYSKKENNFTKAITNTHKERITEACFDWLITDQKIAPKAFAMQILYLLGRDFDWIRPELIQILERDYHKQSAGFRSRANKLLKKMKA